MNEPEAAAICNAYTEDDEQSAVVELHRLFPVIADNEGKVARADARLLAAAIPAGKAQTALNSITGP